jgi:hypothetical protein
MNETLYELARNRLENEEDISNFLLNFEPEDSVLIERVIRAIKAFLTREDLTPAQVNTISKVLFGLYRFPLKTPGLDVELSAYNEGEGGLFGYTLILREEHFELSSGGFERFPGGSDSVSGPTFEVEDHYRTDLNIYDLTWADIVLEGAPNFILEFMDCSDDKQLDWRHDDGSIFWQWLVEKNWG